VQVAPRLEVVEDTTNGLEGGAERVDDARDEAVDAADEAVEEGLERGEELTDDGDGDGLGGEGLDDALDAGEDDLELVGAVEVSDGTQQARGVLKWETSQLVDGMWMWTWMRVWM
jgi:hypothetical protein